jgi:PAS domain S-box-containing protein
MRTAMRRLALVPLLVIGALIGYAPLLVLSFLSIQIGTSSIRAQVDNRLTSSASLSSRYVAAHMVDVLTVTSAFARSPEVLSAMADGRTAPERAALIGPQLVLLQTSLPGTMSTSIVDASGSLIQAQPPQPAFNGVNFSQRDWYRGVTLSRSAYLSEAFVSAASGNPLVVTAAVPVFATSGSLGLLAILTVTYPLTSLQAFTDQYSSANNLSLTVIDQHGHVVAGPGIGSGTLQSLAEDARVKSALVGRSGLQEVSVHGKQTLSAYAPISELDWVLISQVDKDQSLADAGRLTTGVLILTGLLSLVIAVGLAVVGVNLARRRRVETALREQHQQRLQLLDGLPVGILMSGADGTPQYANQLSAQMLGRGADPAADPSHLADVYQVYKAGTDQLYESAELPVARALAGEHVVDNDMEIERPDGRMAIEVWANPIRDEGGDITAAVAAFVDVTERNQTQRDLAKLNSELERRVLDRTSELAASNQRLALSNQELEAFSYSVSHDLRAPLRGMAGFAARLKEHTTEMADPEPGRYADRIIANAHRMGLLIDHLLMLSKLNRQQLKKESVNPTVVAQHALDDLADKVQSNHARVAIDAMADCQSDPKLLQQVYANLLGNALKYSGRNHHARVEVGSTTDKELGTVYYVRDNGVGFDMRFKDKLFGVFQRLHNDADFEGTGVGLAIVQRIVARHGGQVFAEGVVGKGATFSFTLGGRHATAR